ncbi:MAG: hypothetical protein J1E43_07160 [Christensenellaceae bacterium]|nr:hypothetical protein [Christensenellaceae bacterium]
MLTDRLLEAGFDRVVVLSGEDCGYPEYGSVVIALWGYQAEGQPAEAGAWIHPYYFASQRAYLAAAEAVRGESGARLRDDIRVKPIFARLPGFSQGRNTLSYVEGLGSRFHVQIIATDDPLPVTHRLEDAPHPLPCGECRRCLDACPTHAIDDQGFHRERCLRNWMMSGKPIPPEVRRMGNRLIGCDECQRCCPRNPEPAGEPHEAVALDDLLTRTTETCAMLRQQIGANLSIPNRVLGQACLLAGCSEQQELRPLLEPLSDHPSEVVREHAAWALEQFKK